MEEGKIEGISDILEESEEFREEKDGTCSFEDECGNEDIFQCSFQIEFRRNLKNLLQKESFLQTLLSGKICEAYG